MPIRLALIAALVLLSACDTGPRLGTAVNIGPHGASVRPNISGRVAGVGVNVGGAIR